MADYNIPNAVQFYYRDLFKRSPATSGGDVTQGELDHWTNSATTNNWTPEQLRSTMETAGQNWSKDSSGKWTNTQNILQPDKYSSSYSGIGADNQSELMGAVLPQLTNSMTNYRSDIDKSTKAAQEGFTSMNKQAMTSGLQSILNNLASRGMLNSSVASDTISKGMTDITNTNSDKYFQAAMQNAVMKAEEPTMLAKIASLGSYSQSSNPLEPYELMANFFKSTM